MPCILIVDDDPLVRRTLQRVLASGGYETVAAEDGREAMARFRERAPDLVVTDLIMPNRDGLELIRDLRDEAPGARILAISGGGRVGNLDVLEMARELGAVEVLAKPFEFGDLLASVERCLDRPAAPTG